MALLLNDGFGLYNTSTGAGQVKGWGGGVSISANQFGPGRVATSKLIQLAGLPGNAYLTQTFANFSGSTSILGHALAVPAISSVADIFSMSCGGSGVRLAAVAVVGGYQLAVYKDSTLVATLPGTFALTTWYYVEMKVNWAVAGNVTVRVDGSVYYNAAMTLAAPTTGLLVGLRNSFGNTSAVNYSDLLIMDGSGATFNDFMGDVIIETLFPTADGARTDWSFTNGAMSAGPFAISFKRLTSNIAYVNLNTFQDRVHFKAGQTVRVAGVDATFNGDHVLTTSNLDGGGAGQQEQGYVKVAADVGSQSSGGTIAVITVAAWQAVDEGAANNGDSDYIHTNVVGNTSTFPLQDLVTPASSPVLAVRPVLIARKESAAIMGIAPVVRLGGTDYVGASMDLTNTLAYGPVSETLVASPATAAQWTRAEVNAIEVGPKKTS